MKVITSFQTLMQYAREKAKAEKSGTPEEIAAATAKFESYERVCMESDEMLLGMTVGELNGR